MTAAYININLSTHQIQVLTEPLCRAQAIFYSLPNNEWGTKYRGLTYSGKLTVREICRATCSARQQGRRNRGARGAVPPPPPPNNLHKYAVLLITKVCHFKKNYVCPPICEKNYVPPPPPPICNCFLRAWASSFANFTKRASICPAYISAKSISFSKKLVKIKRPKVKTSLIGKECERTSHQLTYLYDCHPHLLT